MVHFAWRLLVPFAHCTLQSLTWSIGTTEPQVNSSGKAPETLQFQFTWERERERAVCHVQAEPVALKLLQYVNCHRVISLCSMQLLNGVMPFMLIPPPLTWEICHWSLQMQCFTCSHASICRQWLLCFLKSLHYTRSCILLAVSGCMCT